MTIRPRREQIEQLLKTNKARLIRDSWVGHLIQATGALATDLSFVDVQVTLGLKVAFFEKLKSGRVDFHRYWPREKFADILDLLSPLTLPDQKMVLFSSVDEYLGAVQLPIRLVLNNVAAVWRVVEQDLCVISDGGQSGLCLEENYYDSEGTYIKEGIYELTAWGSLQP